MLITQHLSQRDRDRLSQAFPGLKLNFEVRRILTRSGVRVRGAIPIPHERRFLPHESLLEKLFALRSTVSRRIVWCYMQPFFIEVPLRRGVFTRYTPDAACLLTTGHGVIVECKPNADLQQTAIRERLDAIRYFLEEQGHAMAYVTERSLAKSSENDDIQLVRSYALHSSEPQRREHLKALPAHEPVPWNEVVQRLGSIAAACSLVWNKDLFIDFAEPLERETLVCRDSRMVSCSVTPFSDWEIESDFFEDLYAAPNDARAEFEQGGQR